MLREVHAEVVWAECFSSPGGENVELKPEISTRLSLPYLRRGKWEKDEVDGQVVAVVWVVVSTRTSILTTTTNEPDRQTVW